MALTDAMKRLIARHVLIARAAIYTEATSSHGHRQWRVSLVGCNTPKAPYLATVATYEDAEALMREVNAYIDSLTVTSDQRSKLAEIDKEYHEALDRAEAEHKRKLEIVLDEFLAEQELRRNTNDFFKNQARP